MSPRKNKKAHIYYQGPLQMDGRDEPTNSEEPLGAVHTDNIIKYIDSCIYIYQPEQTVNPSAVCLMADDG